MRPVAAHPEAPESIDPAVELGAPAPVAAPAIPRATAAYWTVFASHFVLDTYPFFLFALAASLQARLELPEGQIALVLAINPVISGISQPLFAWLGDKYNTRAFGPLGIVAACLCLSMIGWAETLWQLIILAVIGMAGVGVYHPISSAVAGRLGTEVMGKVKWARSGAGLGLSLFFTAGMLGGFAGPLIASRINAAHGAKWLAVMIAPGLLTALVMWIMVRKVSHRTESPVKRRRAAEAAARAEAALHEVAGDASRWFAVGLLFVSNACRFTVNTSLYYLYKLWGQAGWPTQPDVASARASDLIAATTLGMAATGLLFGSMTRAGREKWPIVLTGLLGVPVLLAMPGAGYEWLLVLAFASSLSHFAAIPSAIGAAQRLLPHATGVVGAMLMGCGWVVSAGGLFLCKWLLDPVDGLGYGLEVGFWVVAGFSALAGLSALPLSSRLLRESVKVR
jgi:FSR family fosmidomycin resistance protein-like MFS transporter